MANILILGINGMLGSSVDKYFRENTRHNIYSTTRNDNFIKDNSYFKFDVNLKTLSNFNVLSQEYFSVDGIINNIDYVINCIGVTNRFIKNNIGDAILINSYFPNLLSKVCNNIGVKLIHITTDCVYSGVKGKYIETDVHDCLDEYGKSKSMGEPNDSMTIRTSIIGEEVEKYVSLLSWVKSQKNKEVNGFVNHTWNGITTTQYAICCNSIIENNLWENGIFHIFSSDITKYEMVKYFDEKYNLNLKINAKEDKFTINRTLRTVKNLNEKLDIPDFYNMSDKTL